MRSLAAIILLTVAASACCAGPVAVFTPDKSSGIDIVTPADGQWEYKIDRRQEGRQPQAATTARQAPTSTSSSMPRRAEAARGGRLAGGRFL